MSNKNTYFDVATSLAFIDILCEIYNCTEVKDAAGAALSSLDSDEFNADQAKACNWKNGTNCIDNETANAIIQGVENDVHYKLTKKGDADKLRRVLDRTYLGEGLVVELANEVANSLREALPPALRISPFDAMAYQTTDKIKKAETVKEGIINEVNSHPNNSNIDPKHASMLLMKKMILNPFPIPKAKKRSKTSKNK